MKIHIFTLRQSLRQRRYGYVCLCVCVCAICVSDHLPPVEQRLPLLIRHHRKDLGFRVCVCMHTFIIYNVKAVLLLTTILGPTLNTFSKIVHVCLPAYLPSFHTRGVAAQ